MFDARDHITNIADYLLKMQNTASTQENRSSGFLAKIDTNRAVQPQGMAGSFI